MVAAVSEAIGNKIDTVTLNRESIRHERRRHREAVANVLRKSFRPETSLTLHWDGKMLPSISNGKESVERLTVLVSGQGVVKLLVVPKIPKGTGLAQSNVVYQLVEEWKVKDQIKFLCFDSTASNTGMYNGACTLLDKKIERPVIVFACRHHILELIITAVFDKLNGPSTGPNIDHTNFYPISDYKEFLTLVWIFLGGERGKRPLHTAGEMHRARWMAKINYCLKICYSVIRLT